MCYMLHSILRKKICCESKTKIDHVYNIVFFPPSKTTVDIFGPRSFHHSNLGIFTYLNKWRWLQLHCNKYSWKNAPDCSLLVKTLRVSVLLKLMLSSEAAATPWLAGMAAAWRRYSALCDIKKIKCVCVKSVSLWLCVGLCYSCLKSLLGLICMMRSSTSISRLSVFHPLKAILHFQQFLLWYIQFTFIGRKENSM